MTFEEALRAVFLADAGISALAGARVGWGLRPQAQAMPALELTKVTAGVDYTMDGRDSLTLPLVWVDCWGGSYGAAKALAEAVKACVDGAALEAAPFQGAFLEDETPGPVEIGDGPQANTRAEIFECVRVAVRVAFDETL